MMMAPAPDTSSSTRRTLAFIAVVLVHAIIFYGFNKGISNILVEKIFGPMETKIIEEVKKEEDRPPPPPPKLEAPPPFVPPPDISIEVAPVETTTAIQVTTTQRPVAAPPAPAERKAVTIPPKAPKTGLSQPEYPPAERRAEHTGTVILSIYVAENGHVSDAKIQTSSGYPKLDEAALNEAKRWRLTPGSEDGKPVGMRVTVPIVFKLTN
jgi:protein TonB